MASTKSMKGGKFKFKKKDGTWSKTSYASKSAALSAKRGTRNTGGGRSTSGNGGSSKPGWGRWAKMGRTIDVVSGPAQGALMREGANKEGLMAAANTYTADALRTGGVNMTVAKDTYGGIGTGLVRDWARSKMGVYRGIGQKKLLSGVIAAGPEIMAYGDVDPFEDFALWNDSRQAYDRAYSAANNKWSVSPSNSLGQRFWKSIGFDVMLRAVQHGIFDTTGPIGLNRLLPKGWNA